MADNKMELPRRPSDATLQSTMDRGGGSEAGKPLPDRAGSQPAPRTDTRKLIVGPEITFSGKLDACDHLIIEGTVKAEVTGCHRIEIAEQGLFQGTIVIDDAEISGRFEGDITVNGRLHLRSTARISGKIRYHEISVDAGGNLDGEISTLPRRTSPPLPGLA